MFRKKSISNLFRLITFFSILINLQRLNNSFTYLPSAKRKRKKYRRKNEILILVLNKFRINYKLIKSFYLLIRI